MKGKAQRLKSLVGRNTKDLNVYLTYSLIGTMTTPNSVPFSQVDNLVWLLGAYVEKKGRESARSYLVKTAR